MKNISKYIGFETCSPKLRAFPPCSSGKIGFVPLFHKTPDHPWMSTPMSAVILFNWFRCYHTRYRYRVRVPIYYSLSFRRLRDCSRQSNLVPGHLVQNRFFFFFFFFVGRFVREASSVFKNYRIWVKLI